MIANNLHKPQKRYREPATKATKEKIGASMRLSWSSSSRKRRVAAMNARNITPTTNSVRSLRMALQMSQVQFIVALGLPKTSKSRCSEWETGKAEPSGGRILFMERLAERNDIRWQFDRYDQE